MAMYDPQMLAQQVGSLSDVTYSFNQPDPNNIVCMVGADEMLKIGPDGFWVRGIKVPQDKNEAEAVYRAFKEFLTWSQLTRTY